MKVKISVLIKYAIIVLIVMQYSYLKLLGNRIELFSTGYNQYPIVFFYTVSTFVLAIYGFKLCQRDKFLIYILIIVITLNLFGMIQSMSYNGMSFMAALSQGINYIYILLTIPLYALLIKKQWDLRQLLKILAILGIGAYLIRAWISFIYGFTGTVVFPNIAQESAISGWIRNNSLRVNPPFIGMFFIPIVYYLVITEKKKTIKWLYLAFIAFSIYYTLVIHQSRSIILYQIITIVIMYVFSRVTERKKIIRIGIVIAALIVLINSTWFNQLIDSFSTSNVLYGGSTTARLNAIVIFGRRFLNNPFLGFGFIDSLSQKTGIGGTLSDIGILRSIYMLGIAMALVYGSIIVRGLTVYKKAKAHKLQSEALLILGMTVLMLLTSINIDPFMELFAFSMPFYLAILEYVNHRTRALDS